MDLKRPLMEPKMSHMDINRPLVDMKRHRMDLIKSYGPKRPFIDLIRSHMSFKKASY